MTFEETYDLLTNKTIRPRTRCKVALREGIDQRSKDAMARYHQHFDPVSYNRATAGRSTTYANALIDEALAYCGDPHYQIHPYRPWSEAALEFLARFVGYRA